MHVVCSGLRSVLSLSHFLISCNLLHYIEVADIRLLALGRRIEFFLRKELKEIRTETIEKRGSDPRKRGKEKKVRSAKTKQLYRQTRMKYKRKYFYLPDDL